MVIGVLLFGIAAFLLSFAVARRGSSYAGGELPFYVLLIAWGSMLYGLFVAGM
jgi:hypothetical protein